MRIDEPRGPKGQDLAHFGPIWRPFAPNLAPFWPFLAHFGPFWPRLARFGPEIRIALNEKNAARAAKFFQLRYLDPYLFLFPNPKIDPPPFSGIHARAPPGSLAYLGRVYPLYIPYHGSQGRPRARSWNFGQMKILDPPQEARKVSTKY